MSVYIGMRAKRTLAAAFFLALTAVTWRAGECPDGVLPPAAARFFRYYDTIEKGREPVGWGERVAYSLILSDTRS